MEYGTKELIYDEYGFCPKFSGVKIDKNELINLISDLADEIYERDQVKAAYENLKLSQKSQQNKSSVTQLLMIINNSIDLIAAGRYFAKDEGIKDLKSENQRQGTIEQITQTYKINIKGSGHTITQKRTWGTYTTSQGQTKYHKFPVEFVQNLGTYPEIAKLLRLKGWAVALSIPDDSPEETVIKAMAVKLGLSENSSQQKVFTKINFLDAQGKLPQEIKTAGQTIAKDMKALIQGGLLSSDFTHHKALAAEVTNLTWLMFVTEVGRNKKMLIISAMALDLIAEHPEVMTWGKAFGSPNPKEIYADQWGNQKGGGGEFPMSMIGAVSASRDLEKQLAQPSRFKVSDRVQNDIKDREIALAVKWINTKLSGRAIVNEEETIKELVRNWIIKFYFGGE